MSMHTTLVLIGGAMPEYLFRRTAGVVGLLERLVEDGCAEAMDSGVEKLTETLLDEITINLGNDPTRDPAAGEIPAVPAAVRRGRPHRSRNTVFDDHGAPAQAENGSGRRPA
jgi:hypothetical protein